MTYNNEWVTEAEMLAEEIQLWNNPCGRAAALLRKQAAMIAALQKDRELLDWLDSNIFYRENIDWITDKPRNQYIERNNYSKCCINPN